MQGRAACADAISEIEPVTVAPALSGASVHSILSASLMQLPLASEALLTVVPAGMSISP